MTPIPVIDHAIHELLPPAFHDATCWWQLSSSAGFVNGVLKAHLFFWLSAPASNAHIKAVLKQCAPGIDGALFSAAQPHFIAEPIIQGSHDPIPAGPAGASAWRRRSCCPRCRPGQRPPPQRQAIQARLAASTCWETAQASKASTPHCAPPRCRYAAHCA